MCEYANVFEFVCISSSTHEHKREHAHEHIQTRADAHTKIHTHMHKTHYTPTHNNAHTSSNVVHNSECTLKPNDEPDAPKSAMHGRGASAEKHHDEGGEPWWTKQGSEEQGQRRTWARTTLEK